MSSNRNSGKKKSIRINAALSMINSFLAMGFSLITLPYATRILGVENLGKVNYASSIVSYFVLFAALGFKTYAVREGSALKGDLKKLTVFTSQIYSLELCTVAISFISYLLCIAFIPNFSGYRLLLFINSAAIFATWIGVNWINVVFEDYLIITIRSIALHILMLVFMFILVKDETDYYIYSGINVFSNLALNMLNFVYIRKYVKPRITLRINVKSHIKPVLVFFSNQLALSVYLNSDTTMLGWIIGDIPVGLYSVSVRIYTAIKTLLAALYNVAIPRMANLAGEGKDDELKRVLDVVINSIIFVAIPATFGLFITSVDVVRIISGDTFVDAAPSLRILSIAFLFAVLGGVLAYCVLVPFRRENVVLKATAISAIENVVLNLFLIPIFSLNGAAFTTLLAEATVFIVLLLNLRDKYHLFFFKRIGINLIKCIVGSCSFILLKVIIYQLEFNYYIQLLIYICSCVVAYCFIQILLQNHYMKALLSIRRK